MSDANIKDYELAGVETIARGIFIRNGRILLCRAKGSSSTYLPGGHIEFGETGRLSLAREMKEEMGVEARIGAFRGVVENSFMQKGKPHSEINLVYDMQFDEVDEPKALEEWIEFVWWPLSDLKSANLLPSAFLILSENAEAEFKV
jgi:ADP-ribose pyrophosphatase YjhB (NUDIX family)